jgi:hypothetical protein
MNDDEPDDGRDRDARPGPGAFQWSQGAWFGSQIGGTAWLLAGVVQAPSPVPGLRLVWLTAFLLVNAVGLTLWWRRDRLAPFPALMILLASCALAATVVLGVTAWFAPPVGVRNTIMSRGEALRALAGLWVLILILGGFFVSLERAALRQSRRARLVGMVGAVDVAQRDRWRQRASQPRDDDPPNREGQA